jgi:hypothetical protein
MKKLYFLQRGVFHIDSASFQKLDFPAPRKNHSEIDKEPNIYMRPEIGHQVYKERISNVCVTTDRQDLK